MKNRIQTLLFLGSLPSLVMTAFAQPAEAPAAPAAPPPPAASSFNQRLIKIDDKRTGVSTRLANIIVRNNPGGALFIPKDEADMKNLADSEQDLDIMAHILDKVASSPDGKSVRAMGIPVRNQGAPRNLYIDGYGAIFFLNVGYPLSAPPPGAQQAKPGTEPPSEWDEARRELSQPGASDAIPLSDFGVTTATSGEPYDAERVDELKKSLITELKNAAHIRALKSHETVTIVVTGHPLISYRRVSVSRKSDSEAGGGGGGSGFFGGPSGGTGGFGGSSGGSSFGGGVVSRFTGADDRGNQMIVRASKSDIEAFQDGKLSYDEFRKKVTVLIY